MKRIETSKEKYVVLDVETNGLKAKYYDLLSLSLYKPDTHQIYNRFLPLELQNRVLTSDINGITQDDIKDAQPLTQEEFDSIVKEFELDNRTILIFGGKGKGFDRSFLLEYLTRKRIKGFERLHFYNFKKQIFSAKFSDGSISKDNLCNVFGIPGVTDIHTSANDCILEWQLFEKMDGYYYLVTEGDRGYKVFKMSDDYIIPVSYLNSHNGLSKYCKNRPYINYRSHLKKTFEIEAEGIEKFDGNVNGLVIENLINKMINATPVDSSEELLKNKCKLEYIGTIPYKTNPFLFSSLDNGLIENIDSEGKKLADSINNTLEIIKQKIKPMIDYIREDVFEEEEIFSQEAVFDRDYRILALCDLSSDNSVLEIKSNNADIFAFKEQLFYQSKGRDCYILQTEWVREGRQQTIKKLIFKISQVLFEINTNVGTSVYLSPRKKAEMETINGLIEILNSHNFELKNYVNKSIPVRVRCLNCNAEMSFSYNRIIKEKFECCYCNPPMELISLEHNKSLHTKKENRAERYKNNIKIKSSAEIEVLEYNGSKQPVIAVCNICGYKWSTRADHLIERCYCPKCKGIKKIK